MVDDGVFDSNTERWQPNVRKNLKSLMSARRTAGAVLYNSSDVNQGGAAANCKGLSQQKCSQNSIVGTCFWDKDDHD